MEAGVPRVSRSIPAIIAIGVAVVLEATLPAPGRDPARWIFIGLGVVLLVVIVIVNPRRLDQRTRRSAASMLVLVG